MKKLTESHSSSIERFRLYREDIEDIYAIIAEVGKNITIESEGYSLKDLAELDKLGSYRLRTLKISSTDPYISFDFEKGRLWLYIANDTVIARGAFEKIAKLVRRRQTIVRKLFYNTYIPAVLLGFYSYRFASIMRHDTIDLKNGILLFGIGAIVLLYNIFMLLNVLKNSGIIIVKSKKELPSFWTRQKDNIISNIIYLLAGSILTIVAQILLNK